MRGGRSSGFTGIGCGARKKTGIGAKVARAHPDANGADGGSWEGAGASYFSTRSTAAGGGILSRTSLAEGWASIGGAARRRRWRPTSWTSLLGGWGTGATAVHDGGDGSSSGLLGNSPGTKARASWRKGKGAGCSAASRGARER